MTPRKILIGVCGGVAAGKAVDVVSALRKQGHAVRVVMTEAATRFVSPLTFAAVSGAPVIDTLWADAAQASGEELYPHLYPATRAEIFLLLAATANSIAKIAHGFGSDALSASVLSLPAQCVRIFAPAMNTAMWENPAVQRNVERLERDGWRRIGPASGTLACGAVGAGRLAEPSEILAALETIVPAAADLAGRTVLILSGPTREHIDPIRYIGNPSSGLMGKALAEAALSRGARVIFVSGPVPAANLPRGAEIRPVTSALEMLAAAREALPAADAILYAAAVADYRPATRADAKLPKHEEAFDLRLVPNPDLAATLNAEKPAATRAIGFALQTHDGENQARAKLRRKRFDGIVLNGPDSLGAETGTFSWLGSAEGVFEPWGVLTKSAAAHRILDHLTWTT